MANLRRSFEKRLSKKQDHLGAMPGVLGDFTGQVETGVPGMVFVQVAQTVESARCLAVPKVAGLLVWVGYTAHEPSILQVLGQRVGRSTAANSTQPGVPAHGASHEWFGEGALGATDVVKVHLQQFLPFRVFPFSGQIVGIYPGILRVNTGVIMIADNNEYGMPVPKLVDLTQDGPATEDKARYVLITISTAGEIVKTVGSDVDIALLGLEHIPSPPTNTQIELAAVRLYYGQQYIVVNRASTDIIDRRYPITHFHHIGNDLDISLDELVDVVITSAADGEVLGFTGGNVINKTLDEAGIASSTHNHTLESLSNVLENNEANGDLLQLNDWQELTGGSESLYDSALLALNGTDNYAAAFDKNKTNQWISMGAPHWTTIDFGRKKFVTKIVVTSNAGDWIAQDYQRGFNVYGSDTGTFGGEETLMGTGASGGLVTLSFAAPHTGYRHYKITFPNNTNLRVNEIEFYVQADEPVWTNKKNKFDAAVAPSANDDSGDGYSVGSVWVDLVADKAYICVDAALGAAVWRTNETIANWSEITGVPQAFFPVPHSGSHIEGAEYDEITSALNPLAYPMRGGLLNDRPPAGILGAFWFGTDTNLMYRDNGSAWNVVAITKFLDLVGMRSSNPPASPATGDLFFHTGSGLWFAYDGTRWLSTTEIAMSRVDVLITSDSMRRIGELRSDLTPYFTRVSVFSQVSTPSDGSNYWTITVQGANSAFNAFTTVHSVTTSAQASGAWVKTEGAPSGSATPTNRALLMFQVIKTGAPGLIDMDVTVFYRYTL